jgi:hypothetical protein
MTSCDPISSKTIDTILRMLDTVPLDDSLTALLGASRSNTSFSPSQLSDATDSELSVDMDTDSVTASSPAMTRSITPSGVASQQFISISLNSARGPMTVLNVEDADDADKENAKSRVSPSSISNVGQFDVGQSPLVMRQPMMVQPAPTHA